MGLFMFGLLIEYQGRDFARLRWLATKSRAILRKGPSTLRNIIYSRLEYWPVSPLGNCDLQDVPVFCISLERAKKRRRLVSAQVEKLGFTRFQFIDAVDGRELLLHNMIQDGTYDEQTSRKYHSSGLTRNEIACSLSHGAAYAEIVRRSDPVALIIEDDALFVTKRLRAFRFEDVPEDFDVVFLNAFRFHQPPIGTVEGMIYDVTSYSGSSAAYLVSQRAAQKLLKAHLPVVHAADGLLGRCMELAPGERHPFKQVGVTDVLKSYMTFPDCVLNGSTSYYHMTDVRGD